MTVMGKLRVGLFALATVLVLAGCTTRTGGSPTGAPTGSQGNDAPLTAAALGDEPVDPCSLTGPAAFEEYGTARTPGVPDLDECRIAVTTDEGGAFVRVGTQQTTATLPEAREHVADLGRGATVMQLGNGCDMALVLSDGNAITATATSQDSTGPVIPSDKVLCGLAEGAVRGVFGVLDGNRVKHWEPSRNSLANVSACEVLSADRVAEQLGITADQVTRYPAGHQCRWGRPGGDTATAKLDFPVGESVTDIGGSYSAPAETIAGRASWVADAGTDDISVCTAYTQHIPFALGVGTSEFAAVRVAIPVNAGKDTCAVARTLAAEAWQKLPSPD